MKQAVFKSTGSMKGEAGGLLLSYINMSMRLSFLQIILQKNGAATHKISGRLTVEHKNMSLIQELWAFEVMVKVSGDC
jgi:hypothetical protein